MKVLKVKDILPEKISVVFKVLWLSILNNFKLKAKCEWENSTDGSKDYFSNLTSRVIKAYQKNRNIIGSKLS